MEAEQTLRIEIERVDHGYEASVPSVNGLRSAGLTEDETLCRLRDAAVSHFQVASIRLEIFRN